jgi:hypothetical protein
MENQGNQGGHGGQVPVSTRLLEAGAERYSFRVANEVPLSEVLNIGLQSAGRLLNPMPETPLDRLHNLDQHDQVGHAIDDLDQPTGPYVRRAGTSHDFGIELVLAIRINTRWRVAPTDSMSPHQLLDLFGLNYQEYSLYREASADLLPLDTAIALQRGMVFEAQRDGKYGGGR